MDILPEEQGCSSALSLRLYTLRIASVTEPLAEYGSRLMQNREVVRLSDRERSHPTPITLKFDRN